MTFSVLHHRNDRLPPFIVSCNDSNHNVFLTSRLKILASDLKVDNKVNLCSSLRAS